MIFLGCDYFEQFGMGHVVFPLLNQSLATLFSQQYLLRQHSNVTGSLINYYDIGHLNY